MVVKPWKILGKKILKFNRLSEKKQNGKSKIIHLHFLKSPIKINGKEAVESVTFENNELVGEPFKQKVVPTGKEDTVDCSLFLRSIGYKGTSIQGVPFDSKKGVIPNTKGQVIDKNNQEVPGLFASGWIKRGATGVLGTNKSCSQETVETLIRNLDKLPEAKNRETNKLQKKLIERGCHVVTFSDWKQLDSEEVVRGEKKGKPREKFTSIKEMIKYIGSTCVV